MQIKVDKREWDNRDNKKRGEKRIIREKRDRNSNKDYSHKFVTILNSSFVNILKILESVKR